MPLRTKYEVSHDFFDEIPFAENQIEIFERFREPEALLLVHFRLFGQQNRQNLRKPEGRARIPGKSEKNRPSVFAVAGVKFEFVEHDVSRKNFEVPDDIPHFRFPRYNPHQEKITVTAALSGRSMIARKREHRTEKVDLCPRT